MSRLSTTKRARKRWHLAVLPVLLVNLLAAEASATDDNESLVKAALLYKLTQFVSWPKDLRNGREPVHKDPFEFCYVADTTEDDYLLLLEGRRVGDKIISVRNLSQNSAIGTCDSMYFSGSTNLKAAVSYLDTINGSPILTIADIASFAEGGGMIEINRNRGRLGFRINLASAENAGLQISAPLLQLATVIER